MSDADESKRTRPDETAWREAQRSMSERNEQTRKAGKQQREAEERQRAAARAARERGKVYR
jgi:hypothetical protein